ncbi:MAG: helix-turn-helix transcriptional regulator [Labilithrix sp.]|nr:helix-turn-helix transcriptional regulator [Labilithrix sp.]
MKGGGALLARLDKSSPAGLTEAERAILDLLQQGLSNAEIARPPFRSVRTIANQVASLLRKTDSSSRRALIAGVSRPREQQMTIDTSAPSA